MTAQDRPTRQYSSPLRDEQAGRTREQILDALTELLADRRADEVTTRLIAERAGVSQPTVYRHFPDRTALMEALAARVAHLATAYPGPDPRTIEDWINDAVSAFVVADENAVAATADVILNSDPRRYSEASQLRTKQLRQSVAERFPELDERDHVRVTALLRILGSAPTWLRMREEFGLTGVESGEIVGWAIGVLDREISAGNLPPRGS